MKENEFVRKYKEGFLTGILYVSIFVIVLFVWNGAFGWMKNSSSLTWIFFISSTIFIFFWIFKGIKYSRDIARKLTNDWGIELTEEEDQEDD